MVRSAYLLLILALLTACQEQDVEKDVVIESDTEMATEPGLIHSVYFWLKADISPAEREQFEAGLQSLGEVPTVERMFLGRPANTAKRDVVDNSFDYSLQLWFADQAGQDAYQTDSIHQEFVKLQSLWTKVVVRDNVPL